MAAGGSDSDSGSDRPLRQESEHLLQPPRAHDGAWPLTALNALNALNALTAPTAPAALTAQAITQNSQQRLRRAMLVSDWRFPPAQPNSTNKSSQLLRLSPPSSPTPVTAPTSTTPSPTPPASTPRRERRRHMQGPLHHRQAVSPSALASPSAASSPSPRRRRFLHFQQNTDPLVYQCFNSNDPVYHDTRTLPLPEHILAQTPAPTPAAPSLSQTQTQRIPHLPAVHGMLALTFSSDDHPQGQEVSSGPQLRSLLPPTTHGQNAQQRQKQQQQQPQQQPPQPPHPPEDDTPHAFRDFDRPFDHPLTSHPVGDLRLNYRSPHYDPLPSSGGPRFDRQLLPATPVSPTGVGPRWDSLPPNRRPTALALPPVAGLANTTDAPVSPGVRCPPSPLRSPASPTFSTNSAYSHPPIPEDVTFVTCYDGLDTTRHEPAVPITATGQVGTMYRPDSRQSGDTAYSADNYNFSRPRKPSLRSLNRPDFSAVLPLRPGTAKSAASDSLRLESRSMAPNSGFAPYMPYNPAPRRRPSDGSNMSSSTLASAVPGLQHHTSHDRLGARRDMYQNAPTGTSMGLPHTVYSQAPPRPYNRAGPLAENQQSHLYEGEIRSSVRSHLTASTAQETLFTEPERASVMTKTSSVFTSSFRNTRQSSFFGPNSPTLEVRDSLSVDDVMGMYENGFNDSEMDLARRMSGIEADRPPMPTLRLAPGGMNNHDESRPGSAVSHNSEAANRLLEAMAQPTESIPIPGRSFPLNGDGPVVIRDTNAFFRKSLASSLPKDMRLSFISTRSRMENDDIDDADMNGPLDTDSARHSRHDSGKMVGPQSEDSSPIDDFEKHDVSVLSTAVPALPDNGRLSPQPVMSEKPPPPTQHIQGAPQPEDVDPDANDRYGFRKSNQYISREQYDEWNGPYSEYLARRRKKWESFLKDNGLMTDQPNRFPQHSAKAKRFVRKGIPPEWRGAAWFYYAGGPKILANNRGVYDHMLKCAANGQLKDVCRDDIERDLYRTFPDNVRFRRKATAPAPGQSPDLTPAHSRNNSTQSANPPPRAPGSEPEIIDALRRVLQAFAVFNPSIGYCQSLNFLGGMLLLFVESEEQAFWLLNIITRVYLPGTHEMSLEGSKVDLSVLMAELQDVLPNVWQKISDDGSAPGKKKSRRHRHHKVVPGASENLPPVTLALTAWFMSCFIGTLPIETTLRVWDVFFYEGSKTLFRVALAIFKAGEHEIKAINDPMEVFAVVQSLPRKMLDANTLMELTFKRRSGLNHITSEAIDEQRAERKERLHVERKEAMAAAQGSPGIQTAATIAVSSGRKQTDLLSVNSNDGVRRKHTLFGRRPTKERGLSDV